MFTIWLVDARTLSSSPPHDWPAALAPSPVPQGVCASGSSTYTALKIPAPEFRASRGANSKYATPPSDEEENDDVKEPGVLIGSWTDYTPASALDIEATLASVTVS